MSHTKQFPIPCRFFSPGNCTRGENCHFSHTLPLKGSPKPSDAPHYILYGDNISMDLEPVPNQNPNHDLEINELESIFKDAIQKKERNETSLCYVLALSFGIIELLVPFHYPDIPCSIRFSKDNKNFDIEKQVLDNFKYFQQQLEHVTLVQQIHHLCDSIQTDSTRKASISL
ncbi:unnamed protein product [Cunninghamella echinulata]